MNRRATPFHLAVLSLAGVLASSPSKVVQAESEIEPGYQLRAVQADQAGPRIVRAGEAFALVFSGIWRDSCVPRMQALEGTGYRRVLRLEVAEPGRACLTALTPFEQRIEGLRFEESEAGIVEIALIAGGKDWLATQELVVQSAVPDAPVFSALNAQGAWYSPRHSGSGLTLLHTRTEGADSLVGMWMNFDSFGAPRWYLLANAVWTSPKRVEGVVYRLSGQPYACTAQFPNPDCDFAAVAREDVTEAGGFAIDFDEDGAASLQFSQRGVDGQPVLALPIEMRSIR
jgi:hypothetical protein